MDSSDQGVALWETARYDLENRNNQENGCFIELGRFLAELNFSARPALIKNSGE
jgi:hypothetical protein